jgi:hypothetical protein
MNLSAQAKSSQEYALKAVFLYNFAQFVEWPNSTFDAATAPIVIGILGDDPFGSYLDETLLGETVNGHPLIVQRFQEIAEVQSCHILFISKSESDRLNSIITTLKGRSILTVCDTRGFARQGVMIRFVKRDNKVRLRINTEAVKAGNLAISSKLLRLAEIVTPEGT